jgi:hypothetical protein
MSFRILITPHHVEPVGEPFDGETFDQERDGSRLTRQLSAVAFAMKDGRNHTLSELSKLCQAPEASVSARIRDLRKEKFGGYQISSEHVGRGLWHYRMESEQCANTQLSL